MKMNKCKGQLFKAKFNPFINAKGEYIYQIRMIPIKRLSCKNPKCEACRFLVHDDLSERISCFDSHKEKLEKPALSNLIPNLKHVRHNHIYRLSVVNISKDFETGYVDDWDLAFIAVENDEGEYNYV